MKRLMFATAVAAGALACFAIESANTVGYSTRQIAAGSFRMLGIPWETTSGTYNVNDILPYSSTVSIDWEAVIADGDDPGEYLVNAPQIQVQQPNGAYKVYYYAQNALTAVDEDEGTYETASGWCDNTGVLSRPQINEDFDGSLIPGVSVWFKDPNTVAANATPTTYGQVINESVSISCPAGFRLRAPVFPKTLQLNDTRQITYTGISASATVDWEAVIADGDDPQEYFSSAPQIQVQKNDGSYKVYYYISNALTSVDEDEGTYETAAGWCDNTGLYASPETNAEFDGTVPVAGAFWAKGGSGQFTMTFLP